MPTILQAQTFSGWFDALRDERARIAARIRRLSLGNPGDGKPVGEGVSEMRIDHGPGDRGDFCSRGTEIVVLLGGGDNGSQERDIRNARTLASQERRPCPSRRAPGTSRNISTRRSGSPPISKPCSTTAIAAETGRSRESLYRALSEKGNPQLSTLMGVLKALGLQLSVKPAADAAV